MKKTLALVLALVMVIGMMAVPASAAFTDAADIQYTEAVDVMSAIGVIEGYNNEFNPKGELTRAAGAKLVAYLELGATAAEALTAEQAPFADVAADHWAAGYIGWAASKGYLAGVGDNKFAPDAPLTGLAYAKLMLCALGYDAAVEGYTGNGWEYNVLEDALEADLFDGNDDADMTATATREEAALYSFNALKADMVKYESKGTKVEINGAVIATGATAAEVVMSDADYADNMGDSAISGEYKVQLAEKRYPKLEKAATTEDAFGRPAHEWTYDTNTSVGVYAETPVVTYTTKVKEAAVKADLKGYKIENDNDGDAKVKIEADISASDCTNAIVSTDGKTATSALTASEATTFAALIAGVTDYGTKVEIYATDKVIDDIVIVNSYVGTISNWTKADVDNDKKEYINIAEDYSGFNLNNSGKFETTAFAQADEDDETVVIFTKADSVVKSAVAAKSVTAFVEETAGSKFVADGETYTIAANNKGTYNYVKDGDDTVIYFDTYGYAIYTTDAPEAESNYALVMDLATKTPTFGETEYHAQLLLPTGEKISVVYDADDSDADAQTDPVISGTTTVANMFVVTYSVDEDGIYTLNKYNKAVNKTSSAALDNGKSTVSLSTITNVNTATTVVVEDEVDSEKVYDVYTGYKAMPTVTGAAAFVVPVLDSDDNATATADIIFVLGGTIDESVDADKLIYIAKESASSLYNNATGTYYVYNAVVAGEITTLKISNTVDIMLGNTDIGSTISSNLIIESLTTNSKGVVTEMVLCAERDLTNTGIKAAKNGQIEIESVLKNYDEKTVVYTVDADGVIAESSVDAIKTDSSAVVDYAVDSDNAELLVCVYVTYAE